MSYHNPISRFTKYKIKNWLRFAPTKDVADVVAVRSCSLTPSYSKLNQSLTSSQMTQAYVNAPTTTKLKKIEFHFEQKQNVKLRGAWSTEMALMDCWAK